MKDSVYFKRIFFNLKDFFFCLKLIYFYEGYTIIYITGKYQICRETLFRGWGLLTSGAKGGPAINGKHLRHGPSYEKFEQKNIKILLRR